MISFVVPPELDVSVSVMSIDDTFWLALTWAFFFAALAVVTCWFSQRSWKVLFLGILITATVVLGSLAIQRLHAARSAHFARQLPQGGQMHLTIRSLHLERTAVLGIVALLLSTVGPSYAKYRAADLRR